MLRRHRQPRADQPRRRRPRGRNDVVAHGGWHAAGVLLQRPDGLLGRSQKSWFPTPATTIPRGLAVGDVSGDGRPDLVLADYNSDLVVLRQA